MFSLFFPSLSSSLCLCFFVSLTPTQSHNSGSVFGPLICVCVRSSLPCGASCLLKEFKVNDTLCVKILSSCIKNAPGLPYMILLLLFLPSAKVLINAWIKTLLIPNVSVVWLIFILKDRYISISKLSNSVKNLLLNYQQGHSGKYLPYHQDLQIIPSH